MLVVTLLAAGLCGCAAMNGPGSGPYVGGDVGAHKDFR